MFLRVGYRVVFLLTLFLLSDYNADAQGNSEKIEQLTQKIERQDAEIQSMRNKLDSETWNLRQEIDSYAPLGLVLFLFGVFCALWAQNTGRNPWSWFFLGLIFSVLTVITVLINNSRDQSEEE
jgi:hypothetical protein